MTFSKFDEAIEMLQKLGKGALMGKIDIRHAFHICPVRAENYELLGTYWEGFYFIELRLPFGLRTAVFIFNSFADALHWILQNKHLIEHLLHYLDDFLTAGEANSPQCEANMQIIKKVFDQLGVPLALDKFTGPTTCLIYLGIEIDTVKQEIRLPKDKFDDLNDNFGKLSFAAKVVRPGRIFLRRLIDLSKTAKKLHHHIRLNAGAKAYINWWLEFLPHWNGSGIFPDPNWVNAESMQLFTDASATLGYGCFFGASGFMAHGLKSLWEGLSNGKKCFLYMQLVTCGDTYGNVIVLYSTKIMKQMSKYGQNSPPSAPN